MAPIEVATRTRPAYPISTPFNRAICISSQRQRHGLRGPRSDLGPVAMHSARDAAVRPPSCRRLARSSSPSRRPISGRPSCSPSACIRITLLISLRRRFAVSFDESIVRSVAPSANETASVTFLAVFLLQEHLQGQRGRRAAGADQLPVRPLARSVGGQAGVVEHPRRARVRRMRWVVGG